MHEDKNINIAIHIIEEVIEPFLFGKYKDEQGLEGDEYYNMEESILRTLEKYQK